MTDPVTGTWNGEQVEKEEKTGQWLGATVASVTQKSSARAYGNVLVGVTYFSNTRPRLIIIVIIIIIIMIIIIIIIYNYPPKRR